MDLSKLCNIPDFDTMDGDNDSDIDESALESELESILSGKNANKRSQPNKKKKASSQLDIEKMATECMQDLEDEDEDDDSVLMDPELLKELKQLSCDSPEKEPISPLAPHYTHVEMQATNKKSPVPPNHSQITSTGSLVPLLEERLKLYNDAVDAAKELKETSKVRRYSRAQKTLEQLIKSAKAGKNVNEEEIPPVVSISKAKPRAPPKPDNLESEEHSPSALPVSDDIPTGNLIDIPSDASYTETQKIENVKPSITDLVEKRDECKRRALEAKRAGDKTTALSYMKILKNLDRLIEAVENGEEVDLSNIPAFPSCATTIMPTLNPAQKEFDETQRSSSSIQAAVSSAAERDDSTLFDAPPAPTSVLEALYQRLEKFKKSKESAEIEGNKSKMRRLDRIIKSYEKALENFKAGLPVDFEELPVPPGFAPIPIPGESEKPNSNGDPLVNHDSQEVPHAQPKRPAPNVPPKRTAPEVPQKSKVQRANSSKVEKQLQFLLERQKMFRQAAITAKKSGDIELAKHYLKLTKGFDKMIQASHCGLPVDISSIPNPPQLESDFVIVDVEDCVEDGETSLDLFESIENDLTNQIKVCNRNKENFQKLGDVSAASKFEKLGLESRKDLSLIRHLKKTGQSLPKFHYETRLFSIVQCNTHLSDSELEVIIERGINLPGKPGELDSYIRIEFPIPSDSPQKAKSKTVHDSTDPVFQEEVKFEINRKSRSQLRQFKRGNLKIEVWSKGGFLRSDSLLGTVNIKLSDLESKCKIHNCFQLMEGRKSCGGKLEVKLNIRNPLLTNQVEKVKEKWLVIGA